MLVTRQPVLRRFWYPVLPLAQLDPGPVPFTLLGERIVLWRGADGAPAALADRCCHRTAQLSKGWVTEAGELQCGYHGWTFDRCGKCVRIPQQPDLPPRGEVTSYQCEARYGYVWVCLGEPLAELPDFPEAREDGYRQIDEFYESWACAGLRVMENSFDNAHFSFVHRATFGLSDDPQPAELKITPADYGFVMRSVAPVRNPELQKELLQMANERTERHMESRWYLPFVRKLRIAYPNGVVHSIVTAATPVDDRHSQIVQWAYRNDSEAEAPAAKVVAFDREVTEEDRAILETTDWDVPLDAAGGGEFHMPADKPGIVMRKQLLELLAAHGEGETRLGDVPAGETVTLLRGVAGE
jgi:phenylpropionate dioxygenase-like ring-hydroxylating dioxygenase large terminal subunit